MSPIIVLRAELMINQAPVIEERFLEPFYSRRRKCKGACLEFHRTFILLVDGRGEFYNRAEIEHIRFQKGSIRESLGDILVALTRASR